MHICVAVSDSCWRISRFLRSRRPSARPANAPTSTIVQTDRDADLVSIRSQLDRLLDLLACSGVGDGVPDGGPDDRALVAELVFDRLFEFLLHHLPAELRGDVADEHLRNTGATILGGLENATNGGGIVDNTTGVDRVIDSMTHVQVGTLDFWMDMGVDAFRLDAIPYLYEREGTNCENLPETHEVLLERARQLLESCVNEEEWSMYRDLGFIRVWGGMARVPRRARLTFARLQQQRLDDLAAKLADVADLQSCEMQRVAQVNAGQ